jgi:hypothetical protein
VDTTGTPAGRLGDALREYAAAEFSGALRVDGRPGGILYFADGGISGCETAGAPGLEVILLRSGRVTEADWDAAFTAAAIAGRPLTDEMIRSGLLGAGEAEALLRTALADALFALLSGAVSGWVMEPDADCALPLVPAARPAWLLGEAARRARVLASFAGPPIGAADRITPAAAPSRPSARGLYPLLDGRRSVRDLAFAQGRGIYETVLELTRMRTAGLIAVAEPADRTPTFTPAAAPVSDDEGAGAPAAGLPRRRKEIPGSHRAAESGRRIFTPGIKLLRPRSEGGTR